MDFSHRSTVTMVGLSDMGLGLRVEVTLINVVIFTSYIEFIRLFFREIHAMHIDILVLTTGRRLTCSFRELEAHFRLIQHSKAPET